MTERCFSEGMTEIGRFFDLSYPPTSLKAVWNEVKHYDDGAMILAYSAVCRDHLPHHRLSGGKVADIIHTCGKSMRLKEAKRRDDEWDVEKKRYSSHIRQGWSGYDKARQDLCVSILLERLSRHKIAERLDEINERFRDISRRDSYVAVLDEIASFREAA